MKAPTTAELLKAIQYRFEENLKSNLSTLPVSEAALIMFASRVLTETVSEVAFDILQNITTGKPYPWDTAQELATLQRRSTDKIYIDPIPRPAPAPEPILYPWSVVNLGNILHAYEINPNLEVEMFTEAASGEWHNYFTTRSLEGFQNFANSMSKEDPFTRYKLATNPPILLVS